MQRSFTKSGWPWSNAADSKMYKERNDWPKISIVTPSYNQGQFIEETILSVLNQNYPNLEYIIIDGGSTDNTVEIIKKYEDKITYWVSEKDEGQADAINKGAKKATGEFFCWINSDDFYNPGALKELVQQFTQNAALVYSNVDKVDEDGNNLGRTWNIPDAAAVKNSVFVNCPFPQPGVMFRLKALQEINYLNSCFQLSFDYHCFLKLSFKGPFLMAPFVSANFRSHKDQKTFAPTIKETQEMLAVLKPYLKDNRLSAKQRLFLRRGIAIQYQLRSKIYKREKKYIKSFFYHLYFIIRYLPYRR